MYGCKIFIIEDESKDTMDFLTSIEYQINKINDFFNISFEVVKKTILKDKRNLQQLLEIGIKQLPSAKFFMMSGGGFFNITITGSKNIIQSLTSGSQAIINSILQEIKTSPNPIKRPSTYNMIDPRSACEMIEEYQRQNLYDIDDDGNITTSRLDEEDNPDSVSAYLRQVSQNKNIKPTIDEALHKSMREEINKRKSKRELTKTGKKILNAAKSTGKDIEKVRYGNNNPHSNPNQKSVSFPARHELEREIGLTEDRSIPEDKEIDRHTDLEIINTYQQNASYNYQSNDYEEEMRNELLRKY